VVEVSYNIQAAVDKHNLVATPSIANPSSLGAIALEAKQNLK
jgi:hypothetical protein